MIDELIKKEELIKILKILASKQLVYYLNCGIISKEIRIAHHDYLKFIILKSTAKSKLF